MKALVEVDKPSGNDFDKSQDQEYEIILKDNPYKGNYGDDIIGLVNFRGKPAVNANVLFYVKAASGDVFVQKLVTDKMGQVYFKLSREGIYTCCAPHTSSHRKTKMPTLIPGWPLTPSLLKAVIPCLIRTRNLGLGINIK